MKPMRLLVAVAALALLGGVIWYSEKHPPKPDSDLDTTKSTKTKLFSVKDDQVTEVRITHPDTNASVTVDKDARGDWSIREPQQAAADSSNVKSLVSSLTSLESEQTIPKDGQWSDYGLDPPKLVVQATLSDGKKVELNIGNEAPTGSPLYARVAGSDTLYGLSSSVKGSFDKSVSDLRDKRLLRVDPDKVSKISLKNDLTKDKTLEFARSGGDWQFTQPRAMRADSFAVEELIRSSAAPFDSVVADNDKDKEAAKHNFSKPFAVVEAVDPAGSHKLTIVEEKTKPATKGGEEQKFYYARSSEMPGVYKVSPSSISAINKAASGFRQSKIFDLGFNDPDKIELRADNTRVTIDKKQDKDKKEDQWYVGTKLIPAEKVQTLISLLRRLSAKEYPSDDAADQAKYGLDKPVVEVKVTMSGKSQRAMINEKDSKAYATREGEPSTFEIDIIDYQDLKRMIGELK